MLSGPHRINMIPGGVPYVIHTSQYETWYELSFYLINWDGKLRVFNVSDDIPGWLIGRRPDGKVCVAELRKSGTIVKQIDGVAKQFLKDPHFLGTRDVPGTDLDYAKGNGFTEIAGDVMCEILINIGHAESYDEQESYYMHTANFIIRVEPSPIKKNSSSDDGQGGGQDGGGGIATKRNLTEIRTETPPTKTKYWTGETLELAGLKIIATYDTGEEGEVTSLCAISPADGVMLSTVGDTTINISYTEKDIMKSTTVSVRVLDADSYIRNVWKEGTDEEVLEMLDKHYAGEINLHDYWQVGDERPVHISQVNNDTDVPDLLPQDRSLVIVNKGGKTLATPINGRTECAFIVLLNSYLSKYRNDGYMHSSSSGWSGSWKDCELREWINSVYAAGFPETLLPAIKEHINNTAGQKSTIIENTTDLFALPAEYEVQGLIRFGAGKSEGDLWEYFQDVSNRKQSVGGATYRWWLRSPYQGTDNVIAFCEMDTSTGYTQSTVCTSISRRIRPFGCI